jgi:hypothetical protein
MPPQTNATLKLVAGAGVSDDWDRGSSAGPEKWAGEVRGYYRERTDRERTGEAVDVLVRRELIIDVDDLDAINAAAAGDGELDTDDLVTFRVDGAAADVAIPVKSIRAARLAGVTAGLQTAKLTLADA